MVRQITFSQAVEGFTLDKQARRLSEHTLADYSNAFRKFAAFLAGDPPLASITTDQVKRFLADLGTVPQSSNGGVAVRPSKPLSAKTILNIHTALSSLWTWAIVEDIVDRHIVQATPRPKPEKRAIHPFTESDVRALVSACERSVTYERAGKRVCANLRPTAVRDKAIIFLLCDTGLRASELSDLKMLDLDLKNRQIRVFGKGKKERILKFSPATGNALWRYVRLHRDDAFPNNYLFVTEDGAYFSRLALLQLLNRLGDRAGIQGCHPHRFRHTFAIQFLRNGADVFALQAALGHSSLDMVRQYLQIVQADLNAVHEAASPVANWHLQ